MESGGRIRDGISRHQLLLSDEIAYTSHNSAMCVEIGIDSMSSGEIIEICEKIIKENMARVSDPGLAICIADRVSDPGRLIAFGFEAKKEVKHKDEALCAGGFHRRRVSQGAGRKRRRCYRRSGRNRPASEPQ